MDQQKIRRALPKACELPRCTRQIRILCFGNYSLSMKYSRISFGNSSIVIISIFFVPGVV